MVQDQYRSVMQYSVSREPLGKEKVATDWYCAKVFIYEQNNLVENIWRRNFFFFC